MPMPTKAQWHELAAALSRQYGWVYLECDGYLIFAEISAHKQQLKIDVYVDGCIKGSNIQRFKHDELERMTDIQRKFMHHRATAMPTKQLKAWERIYGKKRCKELGYYKKDIMTTPFFNSPKPFLAKLKKHCNSIIVLSSDDYREKLAQKKQQLSEIQP